MLCKRRLTKPSRGGTTGGSKKRTCLGLPDAFASGTGQDNHTPSPGASTAKGKSSAGPVQRCRECEPVRRQTTLMNRGK